jgi:hypothetical protein
MKRIFCGLILLAPLAVSQASVTATFEAYSETEPLLYSFLDAQSGIAFSDGLVHGPQVDVGKFVIDYVQEPSLTGALYHDNKLLVCGGNGPGSGVALPFQFGFTATSPHLASAVTLDFAYYADDDFGQPGQPSELVLSAYDPANQLIGMEAFTATRLAGAFRQSSLSIQSSSSTIHHITTRAVNIFVAYDNITFVPEPLVSGGMIVFFLLGMARVYR